MVEMKTETSQTPSEQATRRQRDESQQQEVGDSVKVKRREGHHGDGQGQREAGSQRQEFTGKDQDQVNIQLLQDNKYSEERVGSYLLQSFNVLQLMSSM